MSVAADHRRTPTPPRPLSDAQRAAIRSFGEVLVSSQTHQHASQHRTLGEWVLQMVENVEHLTDETKTLKQRIVRARVELPRDSDDFRVRRAAETLREQDPKK